jgi:Glycosyl hydrolase family 26
VSPGRTSVTGRLATILAATLAVVLVAGLVVLFPWLANRVRPGEQVPGWARPAPPPLAGPIQPAAGGTYWGAFLPGAQADQSVVSDFGSRVGRQPAIVSTYQQWSGEPAFPAPMARSLLQRGGVPLVVWEAWRPGLPQPQAVMQPQYRLASIAAGAFDPYVRQYARQARDYAGPVFLEPFHEMNGNWYPWGGTVNGNTTADYVAAWRHLHDLFAAEGATNVTWVWTVNRDTVPAVPGNEAANYWPGPAYVDWVGLDAYNWGTAEHKQWQTVSQTFGARLAELRTYGKPVVVAETASAEQGGDKAAWIADLFAALTGPYSGVVGAAVWFDERYRVFDWRVSSSPSAEAAFAAGVARPGMLPAGHVQWSTASRSPAGSSPAG